MRIKTFLHLSLTVAAIPPVSAQPAADEVAGVKLQAAASPDKQEIMLGEPGYMSFRVTNPTDRALRIMPESGIDVLLRVARRCRWPNANVQPAGRSAGFPP